MKHVLPGGGERCHGAAVEGVLQREDLAVVITALLHAVLSRKLDGAFVRLRTGISQEYAAVAGNAEQLRGKRAGNRVVIEVGSVLQRGSLPGHRLCPGFIGPAQAVHADPAAEINVFLALAVAGRGVFAGAERHVEAAVGGQKASLVKLLDFLRIHETVLP